MTYKKYFVSMKKEQILHYQVTAADETEALEIGQFLALHEVTPIDVEDASYETIACKSNFEFMLDNRDKNKEKGV